MTSGAAALATPSADERHVVRILFAAIGVAVAASTVLHHAVPAVFDVPPNDGIPGTGPAALVAGDAVSAALAWLCYRHAQAALGPYRAAIFLAGSFVFTGLEETLWILWGRWDASLGGTYYFTKGGLWFLETPVTACLGWFFLAYSSVFIAGVLLPGASYVARAAVGGLLATNVDLWVDPVQTHAAHRAWIWLSPEGIRVLSIPLTNFIGWWLLIFLFALVFERVPVLVGRHGPGPATLRVLAWLVALELAILVGFVAFGSAVQALLPSPLNLTVLGI